jgi:hypothetical protein
MDVDFKINECESIKLKLGETYKIESLTHAATPEFMLVEEELDLSQELGWVKKEPFPSEDVHGTIYTIKTLTVGKGSITSAFKDLKSGKRVLSKSVEVTVEE